MTDQELELLMELEAKFNEWYRQIIISTLILCCGMVVDAGVYHLVTWAIS